MKRDPDALPLPARCGLVACFAFCFVILWWLICAWHPAGAACILAIIWLSAPLGALASMAICPGPDIALRVMSGPGFWRDWLWITLVWPIALGLGLDPFD